ncbi:MAG TPA: FHA domain-containing protein [Kofleriaceae bacterium]|nr:FHA domain-containing protein [Kofleriaceae bacterium]
MSVGKSRYQLRHEGQEIDVGAQFVIGREVDCGLVLKGALVSRRHAQFTQCPEGLSVVDLGSLNGVFVNQKRISEPTVLAHGDIVAIGLDTFEVMDNQVVPRAKRATMPQPGPQHGEPATQGAQQAAQQSTQSSSTLAKGSSTQPTLPSPPPFARSDVEGPEVVTKTTQLEVLTDRERQVFELIVLGHTQGEIAAKLHLSVKTIETHRAHIAEKLRCRTRAELVAYALTSGVLHRGDVRTRDKT